MNTFFTVHAVAKNDRGEYLLSSVLRIVHGQINGTW